jgi:hypothetical protein
MLHQNEYVLSASFGTLALGLVATAAQAAPLAGPGSAGHSQAGQTSLVEKTTFYHYYPQYRYRHYKPTATTTSRTTTATTTPIPTTTAIIVTTTTGDDADTVSSLTRLADLGRVGACIPPFRALLTREAGPTGAGLTIRGQRRLAPPRRQSRISAYWEGGAIGYRAREAGACAT